MTKQIVTVWAGLMLAIMLGGATSASAATVLQENLRDCKLPNGVTLLPLQRSDASKNGYILHFVDQKFTVLPKSDTDKPLTSDQIVDKLRAAKSADLMYFASNSGTLWAVSGRIQDLGAMYLYESSAAKLDVPAEIPGSDKRPAGALIEINEGRAYIVECTNSRYVLVRALQKTDDGLIIQYVYQPDGTLNFSIPKSDLVEIATSTDIEEELSKKGPATPTAPAVPATAPSSKLPQTTVSVDGIRMTTAGNVTQSEPTVLEPFLSTFLRQRDAMIQSRLAIVKAEARTPMEFQKKTDAIEELAKLRATEAVDTLVAQIAFMNPRVKTKDPSIDTYHPCVAALKTLGKSASAAALQALRNIKFESVPNEDQIQSWQYRANLLVVVIRGVEGDDMAELLFKRELDKAPPERKSLYVPLVPQK